MSFSRKCLKCLAIVCLASAMSACFVRKRTVTAVGQPPNRQVLTASKDELIARIRGVFEPIQSFNMRADMSPSVGRLYGGQLTDYATIRAYVLFRRPDDIRVIGLDPVLHSTTIFDMVSMGNEFRVYIPSKSSFVEGDNDAPPNSTNKLENLRPSAFLHAMIVAPPGEGEITVLEDDTDETKAVYILLVMRQEQGQLRLLRNVFFNRYTLEISRQKTFDAAGGIVSDIQYSDWKPFGAALYPVRIQIRRPQDGYEVTMEVIDMKVNAPDVTQDKFALEQPPGTKLTRLK